MTEKLLGSFKKPFDVAIIGASGGLGEALVNKLLTQETVSHVFRCSRYMPKTALIRSSWVELDIENEETVIAAAKNIQQKTKNLNLIVLATGLLHTKDKVQPEKTWKNLEIENLIKILQVNTVGPALVAKHFLNLLPKGRKTLFAALSARVGSIEDNKLGGWYSYRCAKAALNMLIKTISIELSRKNPDAIAITLHPGTVDTNLSKPFQNGVPIQTLFTPEYSAIKLLGVINTVTTADTGRLFAWDGSRIPF